ncbi:MAG: tetratricopeptide repeat protein, partial [Mycobacteriales bacterium]
VVIEGEAGLGKSRLVSEFCSANEGLRTIRVEGGRYAAATPYFPLRAPLRAMIGAGIDDDPDSSAAALRTAVRKVLPAVEPWLPLIAVMIGLDLPDTPEIAALDPAFRRTTAHAQAVALIEQMLTGPVLIVVEDAHLLDEATVELLDRLAAGVHDRHWLICVMRLPGDDGWAPSEDLSPLMLPLGPLSDEDSAALLLAVARTVPLTPYTRAALAERAGGNPLFLFELVGSLNDTGDIDGLPDTLEEVVASSIDELSRPDRDALRVAAVLGGVVDPRWLAAMLDVPQIELADVLTRLWRFVSADKDGFLRFGNALTRDVAYEGLPFRRRRQLHGRAGDIIATAGDLETRADLLALHFHFAERHEETWRFGCLAGERARHNSAPVEAARFYKWAIAAAKALDEVSAVEVAQVEERLGDMFELAGRYDDAAAAFAAARRHSTVEPLRVVGLLKKEGWVRERSGRYSAALSWYTRALKQLARHAETVASQDDAETGRVRAQLLMSYGAARARQGRYGASLPYLHEAAQEAERLGDLPTLAHTYYLLDWALTDLGRPDAAEYRGLALPMYEELGDLVGQATVLNNLGIDAYYEGRWDESRKYYERSRDVCRRSGNVVMDGTALNNIGEILSDQGALDEAQTIFEEAHSIWRSVRFPVGLALCLSNLGRIASRAGRFDEAANWYAEARTAFRRIGADAFIVEVDAREAERLLFAGRSGEALRLAQAAAERAESLGGLPVVLAMLERISALATAQQGDLATAEERLAASRERAEEAKADYELAVTLHALSVVASRRGSETAELLERSAESLLTRLGVVRVVDPPLADPVS